MDDYPQKQEPAAITQEQIEYKKRRDAAAKEIFGTIAAPQERSEHG